MGSGMLFVYYIFQISYLEAYKEFEYLVIFLIALSFRDLLPVIVDFTVDVATTKLKQLDKKVKGSEKSVDSSKQASESQFPVLVRFYIFFLTKQLH